MKQIAYVVLAIFIFSGSAQAQNTTTITTILPFCEKFEQVEVEEKEGVYYLDDMMVKKIEKPSFYDFLYKENPDVISQATVVSDKNYLWQDGTVPYTISSSISSNKRAEIMEAINTINKETNLSLVPRSTEEDYVHFKPHSSSCSSYVGRIGGKQTINVSNWCGKGSLMHEILHAVGFYHEQSRPDRDQYIRVNWSNIEPSWKSQYRIVNTAKTIGSYDYNSIMHYPQMSGNFDCLQPCPKVGNRSHLSAGDIRAINYLYPKKNKPEPPVVNKQRVRVNLYTELGSNQVFEQVIIKIGGKSYAFGVSFKDTGEGITFLMTEGQQYKYEVYVECMEFYESGSGFSLKRRSGQGAGYITADRSKKMGLTSNRGSTVGDYSVEFK